MSTRRFTCHAVVSVLTTLFICLICFASLFRKNELLIGNADYANDVFVCGIPIAALANLGDLVLALIIYISFLYVDGYMIKTVFDPWIIVAIIIVSVNFGLLVFSALFLSSRFFGYCQKVRRDDGND